MMKIGVSYLLIIPALDIVNTNSDINDETNNDGKSTNNSHNTTVINTNNSDTITKENNRTQSTASVTFSTSITSSSSPLLQQISRRSHSATLFENRCFDPSILPIYPEVCSIRIFCWLLKFIL